MNLSKAIVILISICIDSRGHIYISKFERIFRCQKDYWCPLDDPNITIKSIESVLECAFRCLRAKSCLDFNFRNNVSECQLYQFHPYKATRNKFCKTYEMIPRPTTVYTKGKNLAKYQQTCQSTTDSSNLYSSAQKDSWLAVDNLNGTDANAGQCSHTNEGNGGNNWLMVDLKEFVNISHILILGRTAVNPPNAFRYENLTIGVTNVSWSIQTPRRPITYPICGLHLGPPVDGTWFKINCQLNTPPGRFVIIHQSRLDKITTGGYLSICELQVFGYF